VEVDPLELDADLPPEPVVTPLVEAAPVLPDVCALLPPVAVLVVKALEQDSAKGIAVIKEKTIQCRMR
jgi:hypothetical protein